MIKYNKSEFIPHIREIKPIQMKYWYEEACGVMNFSKDKKQQLSQYQTNSMITIRYIKRFYPEYTI